MQAFFDTARVQATEQGLHFYEQDILVSSYLFNGDVTVKMTILYLRSGFGIVIADNVPDQAKYSCLFHVGTNAFQAMERYLSQQENYAAVSNTLKPEGDINLVFRLTGQKGQLFLVNGNSLISLGTHIMSRELSTYYLGFYSAAGNTVKDVAFLQGVPDFWHCSIANIHGGRISFWPESFTFENCTNDAYLEQKGIELPAGTFWFDYDTDTINDTYDIEGFVYKEEISTIAVNPDDPFYDSTIIHYDEDNFEDINKSFVHNQGSFTLKESATVIVSFKGRNGKVSNVTIKDTKGGSFVVTQDKPKVVESSYIEIDLSNVKTVVWEGVIHNVPSFDDAAKISPYGIIVTNQNRITLDAFLINFDQQYNFTIDIDTLTLSVDDPVTGKPCGLKSFLLTTEDHNSVKIFYNVSADIANLTLIMADGTSINANIQGSYTAVVPSYVKGPIIVTNINDEAFDLSGSYREVVEPDNIFIDLFTKSSLELKLSYHTTSLSRNLEIFGIPKGALVDRSQTDITKFASVYNKLDDITVSVKNDVITIPDAVRNDYDFIAVRYQRADKFYYFFTVQERELFNGTETVLRLTSDINESGQGITVYGVETGTFNPDYFLRIADISAVSSIDLCVDQGAYAVLSSALYDINAGDRTITLDSTLENMYEYYIVDYAKKDSYAINKDEESGNYVIDIVTDDTSVKVNYELNDTGISDPVIHTDIKPDGNKFVILKRGAAL